MKCRKCGETAAINMRQHRLALCGPHYLEWVPEQTQRTIERYHMFTPSDRILVAVSGGKDSLGLWDVLVGLGYPAEGLYIGLGIDGGVAYSDQSLDRCRSFAAGRGLRLHTVDVPTELGASIPEAARLTHRGQQKPCSVCGLTKRHEMNRLALEGGFAVLATGHNLDDEAAVLFGNTLSWSVGYLARQGPTLESRPGFARKVKPFCRLLERETAAYALLRKIDYVYDECPYAEGATTLAHKDLLNRLEAERPGAKLSFYLSFLRAREAGAFALPGPGQPEGGLHPCLSCGQPTSAPGECTYCRTRQRVHERRSGSAP
ncbi:MAG: adenine nucleotide alpha hydrolase family protein [Anaerolineales bacterium]|nr:adenine nucleotide alpha hydrolase family protein [Anaerolineales bacterium]